MKEIVQGALFGLLFIPSIALANTGPLRVESFPDGADIVVNGVATGKKTPSTITLNRGLNRVHIQPGAGWVSVDREVQITQGLQILAVTLLPQLVEGPQGPQGETGNVGPQGEAGVQ